MPVVGVLACRKQRANGSAYARVNEAVTQQLSEYAGVATLLIPPLEAGAARSVLAALDGLFLPGSGSYLQPSQYTTSLAPSPEREYDPSRDATAKLLLTEARALPHSPVLGSCRGMQELGVHCGASLRDLATPNPVHRAAGTSAVERWAFVHAIQIRAGGFLDSLSPQGAPRSDHVRVNSQHSQVLDALPESVRVEAVAPDGVVEAISVGWPQQWLVGIQWHCEQRTEESPLDQQILAAFGQQCRQRKRSRANVGMDDS